MLLSSLKIRLLQQQEQHQHSCSNTVTNNPILNNSKLSVSKDFAFLKK